MRRILGWLLGRPDELAPPDVSAPAPEPPPPKRLADDPHLPIAGAEDGARVRLVGRVVPDRTLRAPLSGRPCVHWAVCVDRLVPGEPGGAPATWRTEYRVQRVVPFALADATGRAEIATESFAGWTRKDANQGEVTQDRELLRALLEELAIPERVLESTIRVREGVFEAGEEIAVAGRARWIGLAVDGRAGGYRTANVALQLVIEADDDDPVVASDDPEGPY